MNWRRLLFPQLLLGLLALSTSCVSQGTYDATRSELLSTQANLQAAQNELQIKETELETLQEQLTQTQTELSQVRSDLTELQKQVELCKGLGISEGTLPPLQVHYIDVGQGDSILLDLGTTEVLIDGGPKSPGVVPFLQQYVDGPLEAMIATHPHADHIGGLIAVLDAFNVERIWTNGQTYNSSQTYTDFMGKVNAEGAEGADVQVARRGDTISVGNLTFKVLNPVEPLSSDYNSGSIVLMLSYGNLDFLFMGDAQQDSESSMIAAGQLQDIDILKVGHHGSRTSSSQAFLNIVRPEVAIYMAGVGNTYGHPHPETISALQSIGAQVYGTDKCGTVVVTTNSTSYWVESAKPCEVPPPVISAVEAATITESTATVTWKTDKPATSQVEYGTTSTYGLSSISQTNYVNSHSIILSGLNPNITYHYRVISVDNLESEAISTDKTFVTLPTPPPPCLLEIISVSSPVNAGASATLRAKTVPNALCDIAVYYKSGRSGAAGLYDKHADSQGYVSWTWKVGPRTTPGSWRIVVGATCAGKTVSQQTYFTVR